LIFAGLIFFFDQLSKWVILDVLFLPERQHIPLWALGPFGLDLTMVWNRGVTFGLLSGDGAWNHVILAGLAGAIAVFLLRWLARAENRLVALALGAVIGGAFGNVLDRGYPCLGLALVCVQCGGCRDCLRGWGTVVGCLVAATPNA
jgi:lipoprotein signal peptidase